MDSAQYAEFCESRQLSFCKYYLILLHFTYIPKYDILWSLIIGSLICMQVIIIIETVCTLGEPTNILPNYYFTMNSIEILKGTQRTSYFIQTTFIQKIFIFLNLFTFCFRFLGHIHNSFMTIFDP